MNLPVSNSCCDFDRARTAKGQK